MVNYSALKDGASSFNGNCTNMRIAPLATTDIASTSSSGRSARQYPQPFGADVLSRVDVPVVVRATMNARPRPNIERHLVADRTTFGTRLGTRIPTVALDECLTSACDLVFEKPRERAPSRVSRGFRKAVVRHDPLHMQVLDDDDLVFVYDASRQLVQVISSGARDTLMGAGHQSPGFVPAVRSFFLTREFALFPFQVLFRLTQMTGVLELRSVAGDGKMGQPDIDADRLAIGRHGRHHLAVVGQDGGMKLATGVAADRDRLDLADDLAMNNAFNPADFRQVDAVAFDLYALRILDGLATVLGLEARVSSALGEEVLERPRQVLNGLLQRLGIGAAEPFKFLLELGQTNGHGVVVQALARRAIEFPAGVERIVPDKPRATKLNSQGLRLLIGRIEPDSGCIEHVLDIAHPHLTSKNALYPRPEGRGFTA